MKIKGNPAVSLTNFARHPKPEVITNLSERFVLGHSSGSCQYRFPIEPPKSRALTPELALEYHSGSGDSLFGYGFHVSLLTYQQKNNVWSS